MDDYIISKTTGKKYYEVDIVKILNIAQVARYLSWGMELLDVYPSIDRKTGKQMLVFIFDRENSLCAYDAWCKRKIKLED